MEDLKVAAVVMRCALGEKAENLARMRSFARRAAEEKTQIVCFPELNISGYTLRPHEGFLAEPIPGPSTEAVLEMARENGLMILAGLVEQGAGGECFISHFAASPEGLLGVYRKLHLGPPEEGIFQPGSEIPVFHTPRCTFGIELCFDGHFPELTTLLALKGAEIIFIPHASPRETTGEKRERWLRYLAARAYDNSVFGVACNQVGDSDGGLSFSGTALILDPRGEVIATDTGGKEEMIYADLKGVALKNVRENHHGYFLGRRRPSLYKELAS